MHDALAQRQTSPMDAHARVVGGDPGFGGVVLHRDAVDVDASESHCVLFLQGLCEPRHAAADGVAFIEVRLRVLIELARECRKSAIARARPAIAIHDGIAQYAIEPSYCGLVAAER